MEGRSVYEILNAINVNDKVEKKNGLSYLAWAYAWGTLKSHFPNAQYTIYENTDGWCYHTDGKTCWVKTGVTVNGTEYIEYLPVMNHSNKSIPAKDVTSFDVNKAIQRSLTKAVARHGLGLYIYAGEDLPDGEQEPQKQQKAQQPPESKFVKLIGLDTCVATKTGWKKPSELPIETLRAMLRNKNYEAAHFQIQMAINDIEAAQ